MARQLRALGVERGHPIYTRRDGVWYWEHDRIPDGPTQLLIADLLGIPPNLVDERPWPEWLSEDPAQRPTPRPWTVLGATEALADLAKGAAMDVTRRELVLITGSTLTASLLAWLTADPAAAGQLTTGQRIGEGAVAKVEAMARRLRQADDADGGGTVLADASSGLLLVERLIRTRTYSDQHRSRLYAAASDLARQRAAALFDLRGECADGTYDTALRTSQVAGDSALGANVLSFWSMSAYNTGRLHDAVAMANTALASVRGRTTPRVEAQLTTRRGRARAHLGDPRCWADFDRAEELLDRAAGHEDPAWVYWFDQAEIMGARASSHRDLGQHDRAEAVFVQANAQFSTTTVRTHALYLSRQADAQLEQGKVDQACATASAALDLTETISSHRTRGPLRDFAQRLISYSQPCARDFYERARLSLAS
ncbi:transcriptional regulator [Streptomyces sp. NPDC052299]|uniref:transcriptional regulator n=1 Tax=Streptomyces sp. NPDC052299 TaxID=3155054 RepID=UPI003424BF68